MKRKKGFTLIELLIVIVIMGLIGLGIFRFFRNAFHSFWMSRDRVDVVGQARVAMEEMSTYIRQASDEPIEISPDNERIDFFIERDEGEWFDDDREVSYYREGNSLNRRFGGVSTTLVDSGVDSFYVWYDSSTASRFEVVGASLTITRGDEKSEFDRKIMLRGRRSGQ